jgi:predicted membrane-bound spermidine synthase
MRQVTASGGVVMPAVMRNGRERFSIGFAAFASGWSVMSLEMLDGRLMAPVFGQTIHQWGAIIGTALAFMSLGYWAGGRLGGRANAGQVLPLLLAVAAGAAALTPWIGRPLASHLETLLGPLVGAVATSAALIGPPAFALAAVSPVCVARLAASGSAARASGSISALAALGSIGGTFFAAFYAIPYLGLTAGYASASLLAATAALATGLAPLRTALVVAPLVLGFSAERARAGRFTEYFETAYNSVMVWDVPEATYLLLNSPLAVQSSRRKDGRLTGSYWEMMAAVPALTQGRDALFLGVAGGSAVEAMMAAWPDVRGTGVEIDPGVTEVARRRFGLTIPVTHDDARRFVETGPAQFDLIVVDLYATGQIPSHVSTVEFFQAVARRLRPGGVVALNVFGAGDPRSIVAPMAATVMAVFPSVLETRTGSGNTILLAWREPVSVEQAKVMLNGAPPSAAPAATRMLATLAEARPLAGGATALTDELSDMDIRAARAVAAQRRATR